MQGPKTHLGQDPITYHGPTYRHACLALLDLHPEQYVHMAQKAPREYSLAGIGSLGVQRLVRGAVTGGSLSASLAC